MQVHSEFHMGVLTEPEPRTRRPARIPPSEPARIPHQIPALRRLHDLVMRHEQVQHIPGHRTPEKRFHVSLPFGICFTHDPMSLAGFSGVTLPGVISFDG